MTRHLKAAVTITAAIAITTLGTATGEARPPWNDSIPECAPELQLPRPDMDVWYRKITPTSEQLAAAAPPTAPSVAQDALRHGPYTEPVISAILWRPGGRDMAQGKLRVEFSFDGTETPLKVGAYRFMARAVGRCVVR